MKKCKCKKKRNKAHLYGWGGQSKVVAKEAFSAGNLGGSIGSIVSGATSMAGDMVNLYKDNSQLQGLEKEQDLLRQTQQQANNLEDATSYDDLLNQWSSYNPMSTNYTGSDFTQSAGQYAHSIGTGTLSAIGTGASTGASIGGPWGGLVGGAAGLIGGLASGISGMINGKNKAKREAALLNSQAAQANEDAVNNMSRAADAIADKNYDLMAQNIMAGGGKIYIKPKNRGKFTALKEKTGKSSTWYKEHGTPSQKKMATFALNAKKWKHGDGGYNNTDANMVDLVNRVNQSDADFVTRLLDPNRKYIKDWESDSIATHKLGAEYDENMIPFIYPNVQNINDSLVDYTRPPYRRRYGQEQAIFRGDTVQMNTLEDAVRFTENYKDYYPKFIYKKATGGMLNTNNVTQINNGGTHEQSPLEGVPMGIAPDGIPNLVEEGEVIYNDYVYSNRIDVPKEFKKQYKLRGNTFAEAAKYAQKESEERPNDPISKQGLNDIMNKLSNEQERIKQERQARKLKRQLNKMPVEDQLALLQGAQGQSQQFAMGGRKYDTGSLLFTDPLLWKDSPYKPKPKPYNFAEPYKNDFTIHIPQASIQTDKAVDKERYLDTSLRYMPALGSAIGYLNNAIQGPDYTNADAIDAAAQRLGRERVEFSPLNNYLQYNPLDRNYQLNELRAQAAAANNAILNQNSNAGAATAGILANTYNTQRNIGSALMQMDQYNDAQKEKVATFNRATDQYNATELMRAAQANAEMNRARDLNILNANMKAAEIREGADTGFNAAKSASLTGLFNNLGAIGRDNFAANQANFASELYEGDTQGKGRYEPTRTSACGGKLKRRKRRSK